MKRWSIALLVAVCGAAAAQDAPFDIGMCYAKMWTDERAAPVSKRIGVGLSPIPLELRASKLKASTREKKALEFVAAEMQDCQKQDKANRANYHPGVLQVLEEFEADIRDSLTKVYAGDLTWGGYIDSFEKAGATASTKVNAIQAQAQVQLQQAQQQQAAQQAAAALAEEQRQASIRAENERRQYAAEQEARAKRARDQQEFMNGLMLLQSAQPRPMPMQPNISCTSQNLNGTVHTNCR